MQAAIVQADAGLILAELEDGKADVAVGQDHAGGPRRDVRIVRIETVAGHFAETEGVLVELRGLAGVIA